MKNDIGLMIIDEIENIKYEIDGGGLDDISLEELKRDAEKLGYNPDESIKKVDNLISELKKSNFENDCNQNTVKSRSILSISHFAYNTIKYSLAASLLVIIITILVAHHFGCPVNEAMCTLGSTVSDTINNP